MCNIAFFRTRFRPTLIAAVLFFLPHLLGAEEPSAELPRVAVCNPLGVKLGSTVKLVIRGWKLDQTTEVRCSLEGATVKLLKKGNATIPSGQDAKTIGDTQLEVEIFAPEGSSNEKVTIVAVTAAGESKPHRILAGDPSHLIAEEEPNDGFASAQSIKPAQSVRGEIHTDRNVDVFSFTAEAGQTITAEILAARFGSNLDGILTLYDERGTILKSSDDTETADPRLEFTLSQGGRFLLAHQDAHDRGGPAHPYELVFTIK